MKVKNINTVLLITLILTSCTPATVISPTETVMPIATFSPVPPITTVAPTHTPEKLVSTSEPTSPLYAEGPWLLYVRNSPRQGMYDVPSVDPEFILVNEDGSGHTPIALDGSLYHFLTGGSNSLNYLARYDDRLYLFRPSDATGRVIFDVLLTNDEKGGLLASTYQPNDAAVPEMIIYELPGGKIRDRFSLVTCTQVAIACEATLPIWEELGGSRRQWSPNGRYLALVAILDARSSDLFVYDTQNRYLRRLTYGPDWVGPIEWSPDGSQIIMQEILDQDVSTYGPMFAAPSSVWSVSVSTSEIKLLYNTDAKYMAQNILRWLDNSRFIAYEGTLSDPALGALNLRYVNINSGKNRILLDDWFVMERFDPIHETLAIIKQGTEKSPEGIYLASIKNDTVSRLEEPPYISWDFQWDTGTGLFVTTNDCLNDPQSLQAFNYQGNFSCIPKPKPPPESMEIASYPSPNGTSSISVKDGLWLETEGEAAVQVSPETASDIIWCLDSSCFFFSVLKQNQLWTLYHVSLPDLTLKLVDEGIMSTGSYQWVGTEK